MRFWLLMVWFALLPAPGCAQGIEGAISLYEHGKFPGAAEALSGLIKKSPEDANLRLWAGKTHLKLQRWDDAIREFKRAVEISPRNGVYHLWLGRAYGRKAEHASMFGAIGPAGNARERFEAAVQLAPENLDARFDLLDFYSQAPGVMGGGRGKAEAQAREIARISPRAGFSARAMIFEANKEREKARQELMQAAVKFPGDPEAFVDLAAFQLRQRDFAGAESNAQKGCALARSNRNARLVLAAAQIELNRNLADALKTLLELTAGPLTDDDPSFEEAYYWLGRAYLAQNQKTEARQAFQTSLGFDPEYRRSKQALKQIR